VLWEGLARQRLYGERGDLEVLKRLLADAEPAPLLSSVRPEVPYPLEAIVSRALALDRRHRPANGRALQLALDQWLRAHGQAPSSAELGALMQRLFADRVATTR
jgi:serine/threonine-protein kinase